MATTPKLPELSDTATEGAKQLHEWLKTHGMRQSDFVRLLGEHGVEIKQSTLMRWLSGENNPETDALKVLFRLTNIRPLLFKSKSERDAWRWMMQIGTRGKKAA